METIEVNKLYFENCIEVLKRLPDNSIDMFLQDPPFQVTACDWDKGFIEMLPELWELWIKKGKGNAAFVFKATYPFAIDLINSNRKMFKYEWIWEKDKYTNFVNAKIMPMRCIEYLFVFYAKQPTYNPVLRKNKTFGRLHGGKNYSSTNIYNIGETEKSINYNKITEYEGFPTNLIKINHEKSMFDSSNGCTNRHPNRTNPKLWEYFIKTYTNENDIVFDGYTGSGSVPQACVKLNRKFIACENSIEFFSDTEKRLLDTFEIKDYGFAKTKLSQINKTLFD